MSFAYDAYSYRSCNCATTLYCAGQPAKGPHPPQQQDQILNPRECQRLPATCELLHIPAVACQSSSASILKLSWLGKFTSTLLAVPLCSTNAGPKPADMLV